MPNEESPRARQRRRLAELDDQCVTHDLALELLPNGFVSVRDRASGLRGLWHVDGSPRHGDLTRSIDAPAIAERVRGFIAER